MSNVVFPEYRIFTDAAADLALSLMDGLPSVTVVPMDIQIGSVEHIFGPDGDLSIGRFYSFARSGIYSNTSQINPERYKSVFKKVLDMGYDILYLGISSGLSGTLNSAQLAAEELKEKYPRRKIVCIDTLCASVGQGLLVQEAARRQSNGMSLIELADWIEENKTKVNHWFTVDTYAHLKQGDRVGGLSSAFGGVLNIKPLLRITTDGTLAVDIKPRGSRQAIRAQIARMETRWKPEMGNHVVIGHADNFFGAISLRDQVIERFPNAKAVIADVGPVIGAHVGPGMLALIFWGNER